MEETTVKMEQMEETQESPVVFNSDHFPNGLNGDFLGVASDGLDLITKFAGGSQGGGGKVSSIFAFSHFIFCFQSIFSFSVRGHRETRYC